MGKLSNKLTRFIEKLFSLDLPKFSKIVIHKSVIDDIIDFAKSNYPKEFVALLKGEIKEGKLTLDGLIYQPYTGTKSSSWMRINVPSMSNVVGSVHSHPSQHSKPSNADLQFFRKNGVVHLIIDYPYRINDITCYDFYGNRLQFKVEER